MNKCGSPLAGIADQLFRLLAACLLLCAQHVASAAPPHDYYVLSPEPLTGPLSVMSLEDNNTIRVGSYVLKLGKYESATVPTVAFTIGSQLTGTGFFTVDSNENAADLLVPDDFAGTAFVVPHIAGSHRYFILSPSGSATVTIRIGSSVQTITANPGVVNEVDAGTNNTLAGRITSNVPVLVAHTAYLGGTARDAHPVPPVATEIYGIRSQGILVAALEDGTSVTVHASDGTSGTYALNAGEQVTLSNGSAAPQGQGSALHVVASAPVAAVQYDDGDGNDASALWPQTSLGTRHGIAVAAQYLAVACNQPTVTLTLYRGTSPPQVQTCSGSATTPGKAYFGAATSGANLTAGWYLMSSAPVYVMYEAATAEDEHNTLGVTPPSGSTPPTLNAVGSPTQNNPQAISGSAAANQTIRLYVNGRLQATTTASSAGGYTFNAALLDGTNTLYATAVVAGTETDPSNAVSFEYNNSVPRNQSGTISGSVVWTAGAPAQPYMVTGPLTIAAGAALTLQPGTTLRFATGASLIVNGSLNIQGANASPVVLTTVSASPTKGAWPGIVLNGTAANSTLSNVVVEWAATGIDINGATGVTVSGSTVRSFSSTGIHVRGGANALLSSNVISNLNGVSGTCVQITASAPTLQANRASNCSYGVYITGAGANPTINTGNTFTANTYGVYIAGAGAPNPLVNRNNIYGNNSYNLHASGYANGPTTRLSFRENWWGSAVAATIGAAIQDYTDAPTSTAYPAVDYSSYLLSLNGAPTTVSALVGGVLAGNTSLTAGATYEVLGVVTVASGQSLTIPAGVTLRFTEATTQLRIDGSLSIQGTSGNPVTLTTGNATPVKGAWSGIVLNPGSTNSAISNAVVEWATTGIEINGTSTATVSDSTVRSFSSNGIYVRGGSSAQLLNNLITNVSGVAGTCVYIMGSAPTLQGNTARNCSYGVYLTGAGANPTINTANTFTANTYGMYIAGSGNPSPVANRNNIYGNSSYNLYTSGYTNGPTTRLNYRENWWGSNIASVIGASILDYTDSPTSTAYPVVDYSSYLGSLNGVPTAANALVGGVLAPNTALISGTTYDVLGVVTVASGQSLTIPAGVTLRFSEANTQLRVDGSVNIQGTSSSPVTLTTGNATPAKGAWTGIVLNATATNSTISNAVVEWASTGIEINGASGVTVSNSTVRSFASNGIYVRGGSNAQLLNNVITNVSGATGTCVYIMGSAPLVQGNTATNCSYGVYLTGAGANPTINAGNTFTANTYGLYLTGPGNPNPTVNRNNIYGNGSYNFYTVSYTNGPSTRLNGRENWWGSSSAALIGDSIRDYTDSPTSTTLPVVDYSGYLGALNGAPTGGNALVGGVLAGNTTLISDTTYEVLGVITVASGQSLTIPAGVRLRFAEANTQLRVDGSIDIQGTSSNPVVLTTGNATPTKGAWTGILLNATATSSTINNAIVEWAATGIDINGASNVAVSSSTVRNFSSTGIHVRGGASAQLLNNVITNVSGATGTCVYIMGSAPLLQGNTANNCSYGVYLTGAGANPSINAGNTFTANTYGLYITGPGNPNPAVNRNNIYGNSSYNLYTVSYTNGPSTRLNGRENWWGSSSAALIGDSIRDYTDSPTSTTLPVVDYSGYLSSLNGTPTGGNALVGGVLAADTTLTADTVYDVLGVVTVPSGQSLTIPAGVTLRFAEANTQLRVDGALSIQGTSSDPVVLTTGNAVPAKGAWTGIVMNPSATSSTIDNAVVEWAATGIDINGASGVTVSNSIVRSFSSTGIHVRGGANASLLGNTITNVSGVTGTCVQITASAPTLQANTLRNCSYGLYLTGAGANPTLNSNNTLTANTYGVYIAGAGNPNPTVNRNNIYGNNSDNVYTNGYTNGPSTRLNFRENWWGSSSASVIGASIRDYTDLPTSTALPVVDYSDYLSGLNGVPIGGNTLVGGVLAASTTLTSGMTYEVLGVVTVPSGQTLTIPSGVTLRFAEANTQLRVDGVLNIQGTSGNPVILTTGNTTPAKGAWTGIVLNAVSANSTINNAVVEWAATGIDVNGASGVTISNSTVRSFASNGIYIRGGANALLQNNTISNLSGATGTCVYIMASAPTLQGNTARNCSYGVYLTGAGGNPAINSANTLTANTYGMYIAGAGNPNPAVNRNNIFGNNSYNLYTSGYANGPTTRLNYRENWWGSVSAAVIGDAILDYTDSPTSTAYPVVDYSGYLGSLNGTPIGGNALVGGVLAGNTTLAADTTYDVIGLVTVANGQTLTIPSGVTLRFAEANTQLLINGSLNIQGTSSSPVTLTTSNPTPTRGAWTGIVLNATAANSSINYARVEWAATAVDINGATGVTVSNSIMQNFSSTGIYVRGGSNALLLNNVISNLSGTVGTCVYIAGSAPTLQANTASNCSYGVYMTGAGANPALNTGNTLTANSYGVYIAGAGNPNPVANRNNIFGNSSYNLYTHGYTNGPAVKLNFRENWWGSSSAASIAASISDYTDSPTSTVVPLVDYSNYLTAMNGTPVGGDTLVGTLDTDTTLTGGSTYEVLGIVTVAAGKRLTIPAGTTLRFVEVNARLVVSGALSIQGSAEARVMLTGAVDTPSRGAWTGIEVRSTATSVVIDHAVIDSAVTAVNVQGANATIRNSLIRNFSNAAVQMNAATNASQIIGNYLDNYTRTGYGIHLTNSSPVISGNQIYGTAYGIYLAGASNPSITGNVIANNTVGIYLYGAGSNLAAAVPNPTITGNDIFGNTQSQIEVNAYGTSNTVIINATNNYFGTATPQAGQQIRFTGGSPAAALNFTNPAANPQNGPASGNVTLSQLFVSPNGDGIQDTTSISGTLNQSASWTVTVRDRSSSVVRTLPGSGTAIAAIWDGKNSGGQVVQDALYTLEVNVAGTSAPVGYGMVTLDNTAPTGLITTPAANAVLTNSSAFPIIGTARDPILLSYVLEYGTGTAPSTWTSIASQTTSVVASTLGTWAVSMPGGVAALPNGPYVLRLRASDRAGNVSSLTVPVSLNNLSVTAVTQNLQQIQPLAGQQLQVNFTLPAPATAYLRIYPEAGGGLIRELSEDFTTAGAKTLSWDGRASNGVHVVEDAYSYVLVVTDGPRTTTYDPPDPGSVGSGSGSITTAFNASKNDFWKMTYQLQGTKGRVRMQVTGCGITGTHYPYNWVPFIGGSIPLIWDGRDQNGVLVSGSCNIYFDPPDPLKPASVIVRGTRPTISGVGASPNIEVKSDPYRMAHSYEQISKITYRVDQNSYVTVKVLPPGIGDPASPLAITLVEGELQTALAAGQPVDHSFEWRGYQDVDTNNILVSAEGTYTFVIQARSVATGATTTYRGALQLWQ